MDSVEQFDVIVIGAGIIGSWTAYHLAKSGKSTLLLEQFPALHTRGSSHGASRILRKSYVDRTLRCNDVRSVSTVGGDGEIERDWIYENNGSPIDFQNSTRSRGERHKVV
uniref:FAD dependent oxidoreductase domain-containing protein n=1 Tax=Ciona savignyi TaxID=51511 RepID=H2Z8Y6_CIOSA